MPNGGKVNRYAQVPEPVSGYFLEGEGDKGWFSVLVPIQITTINTNPSFETDLSGVTAANSSLARTSTYQRRGVYSMSVTPSSTAVAGCYWSVTTATDGQYSCGLDLLAPGGQWFDLYFADSSGNRLSRVASVRGANYWKRVWVNYAETGGASRRVILARRAGGSTQPFYVDGVNILPTQYKVAYFDGDKKGFLAGQMPFYWNGTPHASTSTQVLDTGNGGKEVKLLDLGFRLMAVVGLGMMQFAGISTPISDGGAQYQRSTPTERQFALLGTVAPGYGGLSALQRVRSALEEVLSPYRTDTMQSMVLRYHRVDPASGEETECLDIPCVFEPQGLAGSISNNHQDTIELTFKQYLPQLYADGQQGTELGYQTTVSNFANIGYRDTDGVWKAMGTGANGVVHNLIVGPDRSVYAGGAFTLMGGVADTRGIAKWNGIAWSPLSTGITGGLGQIEAMAIGADGALYIGGPFALAGGIANTQGIAKWDGSVWTPLGTGMNGSVYALAVGPDGYLYAGGNFTSAGGVAVNYLAKWDGSTWSAVGSGTSSAVNDIVFGPDGSMYICGGFATAGGVTVNGVAKWNGVAFSALGSGLNGLASNAHVMEIDSDEILYVAGFFDGAGGVEMPDRIAAWNGSMWMPLDIDVQDDAANFYSFAIDLTGRLFVGGSWTGTDALSATVAASSSGGVISYPTIRIKGPGILWQVKNYTNGKVIYFRNLTLVAGETAELVTDPLNFSFTSSFRGDLQNYILDVSTDFYLSSGPNNISAFMTDTDVNSAIVGWWTPQYLSIDAAAR